MSKNEVSYLAGAEQAIPLERLRPFANHPFQFRHDLEMRESLRGEPLEVRGGFLGLRIQDPVRLALYL